MKRKLLNALKVRMGWLGYEFGPVSNPFETRFCIAVQNPDGSNRIVFIDENENNYDAIAGCLFENADLTNVSICKETETLEENPDD